MREVVLTLPAGYRCEQLPDDYDRHTDVADLSCTFRQEGNTIIYRKVISLHHPRVPLDKIMAWNAQLKQWNEQAHEQIVLVKN